MNEMSRVEALKKKHQYTWQNNSDWFWFLNLLEEVGELALSLAKLHRHPPEIELRQIVSIAMNWLEKRSSETGD